VGPLIEKHGGKFLARTLGHERLEGDADAGAIVLLEWPSAETAKAFYADPAYQPFLQSRLAGANNQAWLFEGKDDFAS
jgi:uncharacterized protein (DUF1330 family)